MTSPLASPMTHFDAQDQAHMVGVSSKTSTHRVAVAEGRPRRPPKLHHPVVVT